MVYADALLTEMPPPVRNGALAAMDALAPAAAAGVDGLAAQERTPEFAFVRAVAIEAYYSDSVAPGRDATGAWTEIEFDSPLAMQLKKDWSYLGLGVA